MKWTAKVNFLFKLDRGAEKYSLDLSFCIWIDLKDLLHLAEAISLSCISLFKSCTEQYTDEMVEDLK